MADGFLLVDKPGGWTSHDVVARSRHLLAERRVGHAGTLDPMATGLLVLGVGKATRLLRFLQQLPKVYLAGVVFGVATDTLDATGRVVSAGPMPLREEEVKEATTRFIGRIHQVPPMVSALHVGGRRLYDLARRGIEVEREARPVDVYSIDVVDFKAGANPDATLRVCCGSGTYVRTLADDIARALGGHAHLASLRRLRVGSLRVDEAHTVEQMEQAATGGSLGDLVMEPADGLRDLPAVRVTTETAGAVRNGSVFPAPVLGMATTAPGIYRVMDHGGRLLAVYRAEGPAARPEVVLS